MRSFRVWAGIGGARSGITLLVHPFRWQWQLCDTPTMLREWYLGPITLQYWGR